MQHVCYYLEVTTNLADLFEAVEVELTHEALKPRVPEVLWEDVLLQPSRVLHFERGAI